LPGHGNFNPFSEIVGLHARTMPSTGSIAMARPAFAKVLLDFRRDVECSGIENPSL